MRARLSCPMSPSHTIACPCAADFKPLKNSARHWRGGELIFEMSTKLSSATQTRLFPKRNPKLICSILRHRCKLRLLCQGTLMFLRIDTVAQHCRKCRQLVRCQEACGLIQNALIAIHHLLQMRVDCLL